MAKHKDFDEEIRQYRKPNTFTIAGEVFKLKPSVRPEVMVLWEDLPASASNKETYERLDMFIKAWMVEEDDHAKWDRIRQQEDDPVTAADLWKVFGYIMDCATDLPTQASDSSGNGAQNTDTSSKAGSLPPVVVGGR
jgi:hypothetical protein